MQNEPKIAIANEMGDNSILRIATDIASAHTIFFFLQLIWVEKNQLKAKKSLRKVNLAKLMQYLLIENQFGIKGSPYF